MDAEDNRGVLDLSKKSLKKVPKQEDAQLVRHLILDDNELQKIDNIDSYLKIERLSLCRNQLLRMYGVCRLHCLRELNLSYNGILTIEGLKELAQLTHLNLQGNHIKTIEHLNTNTRLEHLNLAENSIGSISDASFLKNLKELFLNGNRISHLRQCDKYLPVSLETLTLAKNNISDLSEISTLSGLCNLHSISISDNPCVQMTGSAVGFDYRPFVLNWCMSVKLIDGFVVTPIESLKAEWLYSQGRGRQFRVGEQGNLVRYLASVCPLSGETLESEKERKLRLILSKAQQHQRQLAEEISSNEHSSSNSPAGRRKGVSSRIQSPRFNSRLTRQGSPDSMSNSYHGNTTTATPGDPTTNQLLQMTTSLIENIKNDSLMTQSLDPQVLSNNVRNTENSRSVFNGQPAGPLAAASKMMPVPESLMSPDCFPSTQIVQKVILQPTNAKFSSKTKDKAASPKMGKGSPHMRRNERSPVLSPRKTAGKQGQEVKTKVGTIVNLPAENSSTVSSDEDSDHINLDKLKTIRNKAAERATQQPRPPVIVAPTKETETSAIIIQKLWRGYRARKRTKSVAEKLQRKRTQDYIKKLTSDMEVTKEALENERKIQQLQMQAISALWKKVSTMQGPSGSGSAGDEGAAVVQDLAKTCSMLTSQVQQLQGSMKDILNCMTMFCNLPQGSVQAADKRDCSGTQTEIVAVHTPQVENPPFPFGGQQQRVSRPSTLPLETPETSNAAVEALEEDIPDAVEAKDVAHVEETKD
ncbi:centrosomal protein of 97 kDa isoform X2 [Phlebotomus argentipes]|uniref:centrosomal protein of 97 kDa isoform X2 n=1 Tax=Phlebotomus argentipes TaxID=94469 RepID=UPI00289358DB|nr:centrosomal protein of 97 kDa isoform X2 [Phlebotomus argentipes]